MPSSSSRKSLRVFFGGTFDPPHIAHDLMLKALLTDSYVDHVHLVPARLNPFKVDDANRGLGTVEERREWILLWIDGLKQEVSPEDFSKLTLETLELDSSSEAPSYTIDSLSGLKSQYPASDWVFAGGSDLLKGLPAWKNVKELLKELHSFWIFRREPFVLEPSEIPSDLRGLCSFRWIQIGLPNLSSTQIRQEIMNLSRPNALQNPPNDSWEHKRAIIESLALPKSLRKHLCEKLSLSWAPSWR